jgi:hypothetical protein
MASAYALPIVGSSPAADSRCLWHISISTLVSIRWWSSSSLYRRMRLQQNTTPTSTTEQTRGAPRRGPASPAVSRRRKVSGPERPTVITIYDHDFNGGLTVITNLECHTSPRDTKYDCICCLFPPLRPSCIGTPPFSLADSTSHPTAETTPPPPKMLHFVASLF